ncbi:hypothetical protein OG439_07935 [Amycolatopsis sp. NBC_01307]|uniref:hypothetical protein n=1 Tax=Amycolatopsis sp. NBC_01307 TaxID=2903561 RepID=UPI002E146E60|nr:hypothetical protein OG439_07935 [Amycolatopsis sp. NBC_01307]
MFVILGHGDSDGECFLERGTRVHRYAATVDRRLTGDLQLVLYNDLGRGPDSLLRLFPSQTIEEWAADEPDRMIANTAFAALDPDELTGLVAMRESPPVAAEGVHVVGWADSLVLPDMALCSAPGTCVPPHHTCQGVFALLNGETELHLLSCDAPDDVDSFEDEGSDGEADEGQWLLPWESVDEDFADGTALGSLLAEWADFYKNADHATWQQLTATGTSAKSQRFYALLMEQREFASWSYRNALSDLMTRSGALSPGTLFMWASDTAAAVDHLWEIANFPAYFVRGALETLRQPGGRQIVGDRIRPLDDEILTYCTQHSAELGYAVGDCLCRTESPSWVYDWAGTPRNAWLVDAIAAECPELVAKVRSELARRGAAPDTLPANLRRQLEATP